MSLDLKRIVAPILIIGILIGGSIIALFVLSSKSAVVADTAYKLQTTVPITPSPSPSPVSISPSPTPQVLSASATPKVLPPKKKPIMRTSIQGDALKFITTNTQPRRTDVSDSAGWVASFTEGSRTVTLRGAKRTFAEATGTSARVSHNIWVRLLAEPFAGTVDRARLSLMLEDKSQDVLGLAMQYVSDAPTIKDSTGLRYAGDADYGPLQPDGSREEGSDFNDYLGIARVYPSGTDQPETRQIGALDCSGYVRMIFGYRLGLSLSMKESITSKELPRRAVQMYDSAPGTIIISRQTKQATSFSLLRPGDLVFQDANTDDGDAIDHVGIYLGLDNQGNHRFISSRKTANGPTMGDEGGKSILNGTSFYARSFVAARRL